MQVSKKKICKINQPIWAFFYTTMLIEKYRYYSYNHNDVWGKVFGSNIPVNYEKITYSLPALTFEIFSNAVDAHVRQITGSELRKRQ